MHQGRLSKFREQAMAVKTNIEYHAIQNEIGFAQTEIKTLEDRILERMLEADDLTAASRRPKPTSPPNRRRSTPTARRMTAEHAELQASLERIAVERAALVAALDKQVLAMFELVVATRNGVAVAEARDGICTICHVRLRPQVFNTVRRNEADHPVRQLQPDPLLRAAAPAAAADVATTHGA